MPVTTKAHDAATNVKLPDTTALAKQTGDVTKRASGLVVNDDGSLAHAGDFLRQIKTVRNNIAETFDPVIEQAHKAHKTAIAAKKKFDDPLAEAEKVVKCKMGRYADDQERKRREEEARIRAEQAKLEEERRLQEAIELEKQGEKEQAEEVLAAPAPAPVVVLPSATPKIAGVTMKTVVNFRVIDPAKIPDEYWVLDESKIGGVVRALGMQANIPGVEVYETKQVAGRGY